MSETASDPRVSAILEAAYRVFTTYGFRRTTMDDIAREAGMSRPAIYTHFRNKEAIFRAFVETYRDSLLDEARAAVAEAETVEQAIVMSVDKALLEPHRAMMETPHGAELIGVHREIGHDLFVGWLTGIETILAEFLESGKGAETIATRGIPPRRLARLIVSSVEGIKARGDDLERTTGEIALLASVIARAYSTRG